MKVEIIEFLKFILIPLAVFVFVFETCLFTLGETVPYSQVQARQQKQRVYFFPKYSNVGALYKICGIKRNNPKVIALGTSRIMTLGQKHLEGFKFYNAGVDASSVSGLDGMFEIIQSLNDDELPRTVILSLDPWLFNPAYPPNKATFKNKVLRTVKNHSLLNSCYDGYQFVRARMRTYDQLVREKRNWFSYMFADKAQGVGLNAKIFSAGFWIDGSFDYPPDTPSDSVRSLKEWEDILSHDRYRFPGARDVDKRVVRQLQALLDYCHSKNLNVVGLLLPFREDFYTALTQLESHAQYFENFRKVIPEVMRSYNYKCYDFSSPDSLDLGAGDFVDNNHMHHWVFYKVKKHLIKGSRLQNVRNKSPLSVAGL